MADCPYQPYNETYREDPYPAYAAMRDGCPVHHQVLDGIEVDRMNANPLVARPTTDFYSVFRYADIHSILQKPGVFASGQGPGPERLVSLDGIGMLVYADEPHHTRQRRIVGKAFSPRMIAQLTGQIEVMAKDLVDGFAADGAVDLTTAFAQQLPIAVIARMLGVPAEERAVFRRWTDDILAAFGGDSTAYEQSFASMMEFNQYFAAIIEARRRALAAGDEVPDDLLSTLINAPYEDRQFTDMEILHAVLIIVTAGTDTTTDAIGNAVYLLCTHPDERKKLEADWSLLDVAVEEILRFEPPVQGLFRNTTERTEVAGTSIPEDSKVRLLYASANRDTTVFQEPDEFTLDRDPKELRRHMSFGFGIHGCIGAALGRAELSIALRTLFSRLPDLDLDPDRPPRRAVHRFHTRGWTSMPVRWTVTSH